MQDIAGFNLGCTANDVRVSGVADTRTNNGDDTCSPGADGTVDECDIIFDPICDITADNAGADCSSDPNICQLKSVTAPDLCGDKCAFPGDTTTFSATFIFELSAQERFDVGAYFEVTPDTAGDGALTGTCDIVTLPEDETAFTRPDGSGGFYVDLDTGCKGGGCPQPEDLCGDINDDNNPIYYDMRGSKITPDQITVQCVDTDADGKLNLPNCTSWRQSGANDVCLDGLDAFPGAPSKCNCDPNFQVPIDVPPATITVVKTATPTQVNETGNVVRFDVSVTNDSLFANLTLQTLSDDIYGDITQVQGDITSTTCAVPQSLGSGATYSCYFMAWVRGQGDTSQTDIVTATGIDENQNRLEGTDDATVNIIDLLPAMSVTKNCTDPVPVCERTEPGGNFTFTVIVNNDSTADVLTLTSLSDDIYGDLNGQGNCSVPQTIALGGNYTCSFTVNEMRQPLWEQTDTVTAVASDEEGNALTRSDTATIKIVDDPSMIDVVKTANPTSVSEPGGDVTYTFVVTNTSTVDTLSIDTLSDDKLGNLDGQGDCDVTPSVDLAPAGTYTCSVTVFVPAGGGNAGDVITNWVTASGLDDDAVPNRRTDTDDATVNVIDVPPAASLTKVPTGMVVTYDVTVTNDSTVEALSLDLLSDDQFGNITQADSVNGPVLSTDCAVPQSIAVGGNYNCTFVGKVSTSPHTNTVTGTVSDDEGGTVSPSDSATVTFQPD